jgi:hypothetical protein
MMDSPVLRAYDTGLSYVVWCAPCRRWHYHGREDGHRVAHCVDDGGPYRGSGYVVRCVGAAPPAVLRDLRRRRPRGEPELP